MAVDKILSSTIYDTDGNTHNYISSLPEIDKKDEKITYTYLASFDNNTIFKANRKVIATISAESTKKNRKNKCNNISSSK